MQGAKVLKLDSSGKYAEIPIIVVPVVYNRHSNTYCKWNGQPLAEHEHIIERWTIE